MSLSREQFRDLLYSVDGQLCDARNKLLYASLSERRRNRDLLLNDMGYAIQTLLRATSHIYGVLASGIEAPSGGETGTGSTVGESPVPKGDAQ